MEQTKKDKASTQPSIIEYLINQYTPGSGKKKRPRARDARNLKEYGIISSDNQAYVGMELIKNVFLKTFGDDIGIKVYERYEKKVKNIKDDITKEELELILEAVSGKYKEAFGTGNHYKKKSKLGSCSVNA